MARKFPGFLKFLLVLILVAMAGWAGITTILSAQRSRIASLEEGIAALQAETVPVRFMIMGRDSGMLRVRFRFYDLAGDEFASLERELPGDQLFIDFLEAPRGGSWLAFPFRIFTDTVAPVDGLDLFSVVQPADWPRTYAGGSFDADALAELGKLYADLIAGRDVRGSFGNAVHDVAQLRSFTPGLVYRVVVRTKGGIEIIEE
ncbi:MAG: hypothetical protein E4H20_03005 [Spirochaetales bacterium]|nr:MAG: hypothetical protein E4H20_03005 [Spirochaetales bacterium]